MSGHIQPSPPERYEAISRHLLTQAQAELAKGDILQASEKAWGATAHAIKAVCQQLGWNHHAYDHLRIAVGYIATELSRDDLALAFGYLDNVHLNYYEHQMESDDVRRQIGRAAYFTRELSALPLGGLRQNPVQAILPTIEREAQERRLRRLTRKTQYSHGPQFTPSEAANLPPVNPATPSNNQG